MTIKRLIDIVVASCVLVLTVPVLIILYVLVRIQMGAPVFFIQERAGLHGRSIYLRKFRSMTNATDTNGELLEDEKRITALGNFLRKTSLDELPSLLNVLKGDMSLVGPRPLLVRYLPLYTPEQARRHDVLPGVTGWASVNGRNASSWKKKFELDLWYVDNRSTALDLKILYMTLLTVFKQDGISAPNEATMPEFTGTEE